MIAEKPGDIEGDEEGIEDLGEAEKCDIFARYQNSIVGHLEVDRTLKALSLGGHVWAGMRRDVTQMISEYSEIKYQREPNWEDAVDHHLYSLDPLASLSVDTMGL